MFRSHVEHKNRPLGYPIKIEEGEKMLNTSSVSSLYTVVYPSMVIDDMQTRSETRISDALTSIYKRRENLLICKLVGKGYYKSQNLMTAWYSVLNFLTPGSLALTVAGWGWVGSRIFTLKFQFNMIKTPINLQSVLKNCISLKVLINLKVFTYH